MCLNYILSYREYFEISVLISRVDWICHFSVTFKVDTARIRVYWFNRIR